MLEVGEAEPDTGWLSVLVCDGDTEGVDEPLADGVPEGDGVVEGETEGV